MTTGREQSVLLSKKNDPGIGQRESKQRIPRFRCRSRLDGVHCWTKPKSEDHFPHLTLVIVRPPSRYFLAWHDSPRPNRRRIGQKKLLQLLDDLSHRLRTGEQSNDVRFDRMKADGMINLLAILQRLGLLLQLLAVRDQLHSHPAPFLVLFEEPVHNPKGVGLTAANKSAIRMHKVSPEFILGESSIQKPQIPSFHTLDMFLGQLPFSFGPGFKAGLNADLIEHVRQGREPRLGMTTAFA